MPYPRENVSTVVNYPAANAEAKLESQTPEASMRMRLVQLYAGYGAGTLSGGLIVVSDGTTTIELDVAANGVQILPLNFTGAAGAPIKVTLAAGGAGVKGKLTAFFTID